MLTAFTSTLGQGPGVDSGEALTLREQCYKLIEMIGRRCPIVVAEDAKIIAVLFKLLDHEEEILAPHLYSCLGLLRDVYQERAALLLVARNEEAETGDENMDSMHVDDKNVATVLTEALGSPRPGHQCLGRHPASKFCPTPLSECLGLCLRDRV